MDKYETIAIRKFFNGEYKFTTEYVVRTDKSADALRRQIARKLAGTGDGWGVRLTMTSGLADYLGAGDDRIYTPELHVHVERT